MLLPEKAAHMTVCLIIKADTLPFLCGVFSVNSNYVRAFLSQHISCGITRDPQTDHDHAKSGPRSIPTGQLSKTRIIQYGVGCYRVLIRLNTGQLLSSFHVPLRH